MTRSLPLFLLALIASQAAAESIYKCTDAKGGTIITNNRLDRNCKAVVSGPDNTFSSANNAAPARPRPAPSGAAANPTPASFPRVGEETQKARDGDRRMILQQEMGNEQRALDQARKELSEQEAARATPDRLTPLRERVGQHERNIQALQKELGSK